MNCTRAEFQRILQCTTYDRMGFARLDEVQATKLLKMAIKLNAVLVWALEDYCQRGFPADSAITAALGLALLGAAPNEFSFPACDCNPAHDLPCPHREEWRQQLIRAHHAGTQRLPQQQPVEGEHQHD